jgi:carbon monoxide dehydrogenase subunit G
MKFKFLVIVDLARVQEPSEIEAKIEGRPIGLIGRLSAKSLTVLKDAGYETKVTSSVDSALTGKLGSLGQPVLRAKAKQMEKQFAERLRAAFAPAAENEREAR